MSRPRSGVESGPVAIARCSPRSVPFPPPTPRAAARCRCSPVSPVLWNCLTPRQRACRTCGIAPSPTDPLPWEKRMLPGSLGFREESFQPCLWSADSVGVTRTCRDRSTCHCCLPLVRTRSATAKEMFSELNTPPGCTSVNASPCRLPDTTHHSRPRRLARSYLVRLFHSLLSSGLRRRTLASFVRHHLFVFQTSPRIFRRSCRRWRRRESRRARMARGWRV